MGGSALPQFQDGYFNEPETRVLISALRFSEDAWIAVELSTMQMRMHV
jgi:hypothetical protein